MEEDPNDSRKDDIETTTEMEAEAATNGAEEDPPSTEMNGTELPEPIAVNDDASHDHDDDLQTQQGLKEKDEPLEEVVVESLHEALVPEVSTKKKRGRGRQRKRVKISNEPSIDIAVVVPKPSSQFESNSIPPETKPDTKPTIESDMEPPEGIATDPSNAFAASVAEAANSTPDTTKTASTSFSVSILPGSPQEDGASSKPASAVPTPSPPPPDPDPDPEAEAEAKSEAKNEAKSEEPSSSTIIGTPQDVVIRNITGPGALAQKILQVDGRITNPPNGNAWKVFRCYRDNQDMGSLWEVRQAWFVKVTK